MNWLLNRVRLKREQFHHRKLKQLQKVQWDRIHAIEGKYRDLNFFAHPEANGDEPEKGFVPEAREKYLLYLLQRVGIHFIPDEALVLARKFGPALAADRVCRWLGLDYHKIAAVAPRVASETVRATTYFKEMKDSCAITGINPAALLPHIHFGSHDTRDILFENFRLAARTIELYDGFNRVTKEQIGWNQNRPTFIDAWKDITTECLMQYYHQGLLLAEYRKIVEACAKLLGEQNENIILMAKKWLNDETASGWQTNFPEFADIKVQVHLSNIVREFDYKSSRLWNQILKQISEAKFDFQVSAKHERL